MLAARPGHLLPQAGVPVRPSPFSVGELEVVIPRGFVYLCKCWTRPPSSKDQEEGGPRAT